MPILKIARMGHPVLLRRADPVENPRDPAIARLIDDMIETVEDADGAGLAAPQVHMPLRLFVYRVPAIRSTGPADPPKPLSALINPVIEPIGDEIAVGFEGCLSIPGLRGAVPRPARIRVRGLDREGREVDELAEGFAAVVIQHEVDHLDGILYPSRIVDFSTFGFVDEQLRAAAPIQADQPE